MRSKLSDSIKSTLPTLITTIVGSLIALGGVYIGSTYQKDIWYRQTHLDQFNRIINKRIELISDMAEALTNAQRAELLDGLIDKYNEKIHLEYKFCFDEKTRHENKNVCEHLTKDGLDTSDIYLQHANMQAAYLKAVVLSNIYFCANTKAVLKSIQDRDEQWWKIGLEQQGSLLETMQSEMHCGLNTDVIFK